MGDSSNSSSQSSSSSFCSILCLLMINFLIPIFSGSSLKTIILRERRGGNDSSSIFSTSDTSD